MPADGVPHLACTACGEAPLSSAGLAWQCRSCGRSFPVICGIPDLRLEGDRYLGLEAERDKARRLAERAEHLSFVELLEYYYTITDDVAPRLAARYAQAARSAPARCAAIVDDLAAALPAGARVLDVGCATGGALVAGTARGLQMVGVDVALRWLVICRKRLADAGLDVPLCCADVRSLPFAPGSFDGAMALDLFDHLDEPGFALANLRRVLDARGICVLTAANRYSPGPDLNTGIWAVGWLPGAARRRLLQRRLGVDALQFAELRSWRQLRALAGRSGFAAGAVNPRRIVAEDPTRSRLERALMRGYARLQGSGLGRALLRELSPSFELWLERPRATQTS